MVSKEYKQPNGKYMGFQTTAYMMHWNQEKPSFGDYSLIFDDWNDFCESVEGNQGFTKNQLEKLIKELPEPGICDYSGFDYLEHWDYMHRDRKFPEKEDPLYPSKDCNDCKVYKTWQDIMQGDD